MRKKFIDQAAKRRHWRRPGRGVECDSRAVPLSGSSDSRLACRWTTRSAGSGSRDRVTFGGTAAIPNDGGRREISAPFLTDETTAAVCLRADQPLHLAGRPASHRPRNPAASSQRLHPAHRISGKPLMARLALDPELPTKLRHRKMTPPRQTHKLRFLFHR